MIQEANVSWQVRIQDMIAALTEKDIGVLFLIDEIKAKHDGFREFASTYQLLQRADLKVGLFMAGLPENVSDVLNEDMLTFLRRSNQITLGPIDEGDIAAFFLKVFSENLSLGLEDALAIAACTKGYPYYFQLIGYNIWNISNGTYNPEILGNAIALSNIKLYRNVLAPIAHALGQKELEFLMAMAKTELPASSGDTEKALGMNHGAFSVYRSRLIEKQIIYAPQRGLIDFVLPFSKEYFRQAAG
jgi:hypothetical protein